MEGLNLSASVFTYALVFSRAGAIMMLLPGIGEVGVPTRIRLALAFSVTLIIGNIVGNDMPPLPDEPFVLAGLIIQEVIIGLYFGVLARLMMSALVVAGQVASMQSGLGFAMSFDPTQGQQGAVMATFLNLVAVTLVFVSGLHHLFLTGIVGSYAIIPAGSVPMLGDAAQLGTQVVAQSFRVGMQMAAPLIAFGLVFYLALGVLSRLMPQVQIFFVAMPLNVFAGLAIFTISMGSMLNVWLRHIENFAQSMN
ncbi:MAG: flagellar biosynthetic protein FliR [Robiginitomaculum sp.]|nr:MAG: flagellar biosynthetic protein FliR [Robiginitomaculum sp.]